MTILAAVNKMQADMAGLTGHAHGRTSGTGATMADAAQLLHGEAGSLGYLFDTYLVRPVSSALEHPATGTAGPLGGRTPYPDTVVPNIRTNPMQPPLTSWPAIPPQQFNQVQYVLPGQTPDYSGQGGVVVYGQRVPGFLRPLVERVKNAFTPKPSEGPWNPVPTSGQSGHAVGSAQWATATPIAPATYPTRAAQTATATGVATGRGGVSTGPPAAPAARAASAGAAGPWASPPPAGSAGAAWLSTVQNWRQKFLGR